MFFDNLRQFWKQIVAVIATWIFVFAGPIILLKVV
jgi:hypothetical protein